MRIAPDSNSGSGLPSGPSLSTLARVRLLGFKASNSGVNCSPLPMLTGCTRYGSAHSSSMMETLRPFGVLQVERSITGALPGQARECILSPPMIKWLLTIFIALAVLAAATPWLQRLGVGRLPGDLKFTVRGRASSLPLASTVLFCLVAWVIGRLLYG